VDRIDPHRTLKTLPAATGDLARAVFFGQNIVRRYIYPRVRGMGLPGARVVLYAARFVYWYGAMAGKVRVHAGRPVLRQLRDIITLGTRHRLDAQAYYMFEFYRPERFDRAGDYLTRFETKNGIYTLLTRMRPDNQTRTRLDDKVGFRDFCARHGLPYPAVIGVARNGALHLEQPMPDGPAQDIFVKPVKSKGSKGAEAILRIGPGRYRDSAGREMDWTTLASVLAERSKAMPLLLQAKLSNHPDMAPLAGESLIVIRMITCWDRGEAILTHAMLRIIPKLEIKWGLGSELGAAVDLKTGRLGPMTGDKKDSRLSWWDDHPVTGARVTGRVVPHWAEAKRLVLAAQRATLGRPLVGWDVALTPEGPVLLEGNSYPDVDFPQRTHCRGIGESLLGPPLRASLIELQRYIDSGGFRR
jgi:hypothetical protein